MVWNVVGILMDWNGNIEGNCNINHLKFIIWVFNMYWFSIEWKNAHVKFRWEMKTKFNLFLKMRVKKYWNLSWVTDNISSIFVLFARTQIMNIHQQKVSYPVGNQHRAQNVSVWSTYASFNHIAFKLYAFFTSSLLLFRFVFT